MIELEQVLNASLAQLPGRSDPENWTLCAGLFAAMWPPASPLLRAHPVAAAQLLAGFGKALARAGGIGDETAARAALTELETFDIEDDGSSDWQRIMDLASALIPVLSGEPPLACAQQAVTIFLEGQRTSQRTDWPSSWDARSRTRNRPPDWRASRAGSRRAGWCSH